MSELVRRDAVGRRGEDWKHVAVAIQVREVSGVQVVAGSTGPTAKRVPLDANAAGQLVANYTEFGSEPSAVTDGAMRVSVTHGDFDLGQMPRESHSSASDGQFTPDNADVITAETWRSRAFQEFVNGLPDKDLHRLVVAYVPHDHGDVTLAPDLAARWRVQIGEVKHADVL